MYNKGGVKLVNGLPINGTKSLPILPAAEKI